MLHKLANNGAELSSDDPEKQKTLFEKYKQYQIPVSISFLIIFQSIIWDDSLYRKRKSIGLVYYRMKHWINSKKKMMKTMKNLFVHGKNSFVNHSLLNSPDERETMNRSISHRSHPNRTSAISLQSNPFSFLCFSKPKTLKDKVINKLWGS